MWLFVPFADIFRSSLPGPLVGSHFSAHPSGSLMWPCAMQVDVLVRKSLSRENVWFALFPPAAALIVCHSRWWQRLHLSWLLSEKILEPLPHHHDLKLHLLWTRNKALLFSSVQPLSRVRLFVTLWTTARQASLSITSSRSPPKPMSIELVMPSNHLIFCRPLLLLPSIFPSIRVFSNESALHIRWPKYWSFSFSISPSNENPGLISFRMDWLELLLSRGLSRVFSNTTVQKHQFFGTQLSL